MNSTDVHLNLRLNSCLVQMKCICILEDSIPKKYYPMELVGFIGLETIGIFPMRYFTCNPQKFLFNLMNVFSQ